jgi:ABC-type transport system involved in multi-copper enzyme maturation permease subunit
MIGKLLFIEWMKARRRKTFWLALLASPVMTIMMMLPVYLMRRSRPELPGISMPDSWPTILNAAAGAGAAILASALALLVASEGGWRTQRQNVIDGLSRTEYVAGKFVFTLAFVTAAWAVMIGVATVLGHLNTGLDGTGWSPFAEGTHYLMMGGGLLYVLMMATVGTFFGLLLGSSGAALGCTVLFIIGQPGILIPILMAKGGGWLKVIPYLPTSVGDSLTTAATYDGARYAELLESSRLGILSAGVAAPLAMLYISLFVWVGWVTIRRRDL